MAENYTIETDIIYEGNGVVKEFPITFSFSNESEVAVFLNGQVIRRGYKVEDGNVVFTIAPANGDVVSILKATAPEYVGGTEKEPEDNGYGNIYIQTDQDQLEVAQIASQVNYVGNGVTTDFPTTFSFENSNEVVVYVNSRLVRSGYTVNNEAVIFDEAPANGDTITVLKLDLSEYVEEDEKEEEEKEEESSTVFDQASQEHIKINPVQTKVKYTGNGAVYEFPTIFAFFEDDNVVVYLNGSIINGGYSVSGVGETDGGLVIFDTPPAEGDKIVILRKVVVERVTDFQEGGSFRAKNINDELDRMTAFCQQIEEEMSRCVKVEVTDDQDPKELIDKVFDQLDLATEVGEAAIKTAEETAAMIEGLKETVNAETEIAIERVNVAAEDNIEKSRIWAEGEQEEVEALGGELSSRGFADFAMAIANTPEDVPLEESKLIALDIVRGPKGDKGDKGNDGSGVQIGDIGIAPLGIDETLNLRRYLNGQVISQAQFVSFTNWVKERAKLYPNVVTTEENWQAEVTNSKLGQCGKFVIDDELGTIRLPKAVNINGLQDLALMGSIKAESLPNITGEFRNYGWNASLIVDVVHSGALYRSGTARPLMNGGSSGSGSYIDGFAIDASRSSSSYKNGATVQQEAIQYPYYIQVATGYETYIDVKNEIQLNNPFFFGMSQYFESAPNNMSWLLSDGTFYSGDVYDSFYEWLLKIKNGTLAVDGVSVKDSTDSYGDYDYVVNTSDRTFRLPNRTKDDYVVDSYVNGASWWRVYKSGWIEQGGIVSKTSNPTYAVFSKNMKNTSYNATCCFDYSNSSSKYEKTEYILRENNRIGIYMGSYNNQAGNSDKTSIIWGVSGQGANAPVSRVYFYVGDTVQNAGLISATGVISEISKKVNKDDADYIIESYNNGTNWYKKYKSGWVEQGGYSSNASITSATTKTINLIVPMANTKYYITRTVDKNSIGNDPGSRWISGANSGSRKTTSFTMFTDQVGYVYGDWWEVRGQGA